jgi:hypothetical protein
LKKIFIIFFICSVTGFAQEFYISNAIVYSIVAGYTEGLQLKERYDVQDSGEKRKINSLWHNTQLAERGLGISLGIAIGDFSGLNWKKIALSLLLSAAIYWNLYDGTINMVRQKSFYHISNTSTAITEKYGGFKIPVLAVSIGLNLLLGAFSE